jgi:hypothetical protein
MEFMRTTLFARSAYLSLLLLLFILQASVKLFFLLDVPQALID